MREEKRERGENWRRKGESNDNGPQGHGRPLSLYSESAYMPMHISKTHVRLCLFLMTYLPHILVYFYFRKSWKKKPTSLFLKWISKWCSVSCIFQPAHFLHSLLPNSKQQKIKQGSECRNFQARGVMSAPKVIQCRLILHCFVSPGKLGFCYWRKVKLLWAFCRNITLEMKQHCFRGAHTQELPSACSSIQLCQ